VRAIWKGAVSFGLVNVPVKLYAATGEKDVKFHQVHAEDGGRIRYRRVCSVDDEDFAQLPLKTGREIDVVEFVPAEQVDPIMFAKTYYLEPEKTALKPYALLREALVETDRMAVVKVALRQRETLAVLRVRDKVIVLQTMLWPDEVRAADFEILDADVDLRPQELTMASSLVESLAGDFEPDQFSDDYATALRELIDAKVSSGEVRAPAAEAEEEGGGEVVDLLTALQRSVDRAKAGRGEATSGEPAAEKAPATKAAAKKAPTKKAPAKKTAAKKTAAKTAAEVTPAKKSASKSAAKKSATKTPAKKARKSA